MAETIKGFPWRVGMQSVPDRNGRVYRVFRAPALRDGSPEEADEGPPIADALCVAKVGPYELGADMVFELDEDDAPDRNDPATVGAFLGAVREAFGEPLMFVRPAAGGWMVYRVANPGLIERDEVLLTSGQWFDAAEWGNVDDPIRGATEWDATEAAWNVRPGVKRG